ncbi:MAG: hypothetical protein K1W00_00400 [Lachnospiraceae bacterium]
MIWKGIKLEFYRAFHNIWYVGALLAATAIALVQFFAMVMPKTVAIGSGDSIDYPHSVFNSSLMFCLGSFYDEIFYLSIILLATVPYAASYYMDVKEGYIKNISTRMDTTGYLMGKYLAVFVSAGSICAIPLILNTYLTAMVLPSLKPEIATAVFPVIKGSFAQELFYTYPYLYTLLYIVIDFIMAGLYGCLALVISKIVNNRYIVMFFPFVVYLVFRTVITYTPLEQLSPYYIMDPQQFGTIEEAPYIISGMAALFLITAAGFKIAGGKRNDIL